jgi:hypothetical protein
VPGSDTAIWFINLTRTPTDNTKTYLHKQEQVRILTFGGGPVALLDVVFGDIDTLHMQEIFVSKLM